MDTINLVIEWTHSHIVETDKFAFIQFAMDKLCQYPEANLSDIRNQFVNQ
jgi:hypothetical protein